MKKTAKTLTKLLALALTLCLLHGTVPFGAAAQEGLPYAFADVVIGSGRPVYAGASVTIDGRLENVPQSGSYQLRFVDCYLYDGAALAASGRLYIFPNDRFMGTLAVPAELKEGSYLVRLYYADDDGTAWYEENICLYEPASLTIAVTAPYQVAAGAWFTLEGTVTNADGTPTGNCEVLICNDPNFGICWSRTTNAEGRFSFDYKYDTESALYFYVKSFGDAYHRSNVASAVTYVTGDDHTVTVSSSANGTAACSAPSAKLGDVVTLTAMPEEGYRLKEWQVISGDVTVENSSFIMPAGDVALKAVFEKKRYTVTVDLGEYGEDITVSVEHGKRFFEAMYDAGVYDTLDEMEDEDHIFRDLATLPLSAFAGDEAFGEDAWALLDTSVTADMTVYACFFRKIKSVGLTLGKPVAGTAVTWDDDYVQTPAPEIALAGGAHCFVEDNATWDAANSEGEPVFFSGTFAEGATYYAELVLSPDFGYWLDDNTVITANGATVEETGGRMSIMVILKTKAVAPPVLGDANGDGSVNVRDVTAIQRHLVELEPLAGAHLTAADVDGDGVVTIDDATVLQEYLAEYDIAYPIGV